PEDPVTGSLNASLAQWLRATDRAPERWSVRQGTVLGRAGRVDLEDDGTDIWVGGRCEATVVGLVDL
ncbi:MAG: PhzF family phenazine biosynthesis protein, partial [Actinobacteria bacterium]|nr:PhzF family phenazine biosynthesis protein [Actinomycetota bacterium]